MFHGGVRSFVVALAGFAAACSSAQAPVVEAGPTIDVAVSSVATTDTAGDDTPAKRLLPRHVAAAPSSSPEVASEPSGTPPDQLAAARLFFKQGVAAFAANDLPLAELAFGKAYMIAPRPQVLFNLAKVLLAEGKTNEACATFEHYWLMLPQHDQSKRAELPVAQCPRLAAMP